MFGSPNKRKYYCQKRKRRGRMNLGCAMGRTYIFSRVEQGPTEICLSSHNS